MFIVRFLRFVCGYVGNSIYGIYPDETLQKTPSFCEKDWRIYAD